MESDPVSSLIELVRPLWPGDYIGFTIDGSPVQLFRFGRVDPKKMMGLVTEEQFTEYYIYWMERRSAAAPILHHSHVVAASPLRCCRITAASLLYRCHIAATSLPHRCCSWVFDCWLCE